jgi:retron-type reverse transcriptase
MIATTLSSTGMIIKKPAPFTLCSLPTRKITNFCQTFATFTDEAILRRWLKAGYLHNRILHSTEAGTPQGGIVSPTLMNMTLDGLEQVLVEKFYKGSKSPLKVHFVRYADDCVPRRRDERKLSERHAA